MDDNRIKITPEALLLVSDLTLLFGDSPRYITEEKISWDDFILDLYFMELVDKSDKTMKLESSISRNLTVKVLKSRLKETNFKYIKKERI